MSQMTPYDRWRLASAPDRWVPEEEVEPGEEAPPECERCGQQGLHTPFCEHYEIPVRRGALEALIRGYTAATATVALLDLPGRSEQLAAADDAADELSDALRALDGREEGQR